MQKIMVKLYDECPPGKFGITEGLSSCEKCPGGFAQPLPGQSACDICPLGKYAYEGAPECTTCSISSVAESPGSTECTPCDKKAEASDDHTRCLCNVGYASIKNDSSEYALDCIKCPEGALCEERGLAYDTLETAPGYWLAPNQTAVYYRCPYIHYCQGGLLSLDEQCDNNRFGPLCAQCKDGYTPNFEGRCVECYDEGASWAMLILIGVLAVVLLWFQFYILLKAARPLIEASVLEDQRIQRMKEGFKDDMAEFDGFDADLRYEGVITIHGSPSVKPDFTYKLKIVLSFVQIVTNLSIGLDIQWPTQFISFIETFNFFNLDLVSLAGADCVVDSNYWYNLYFLVIFSYCIIKYNLFILLCSNYGSKSWWF